MVCDIFPRHLHHIQLNLRGPDKPRKQHHPRQQKRKASDLALYFICFIHSSSQRQLDLIQINNGKGNISVNCIRVFFRKIFLTVFTSFFIVIYSARTTQHVTSPTRPTVTVSRRPVTILPSLKRE